MGSTSLHKFQGVRQACNRHFPSRPVAVPAKLSWFEMRRKLPHIIKRAHAFCLCPPSNHVIIIGADVIVRSGIKALNSAAKIPTPLL
jgi:hypothetical protein